LPSNDHHTPVEAANPADKIFC